MKTTARLLVVALTLTLPIAFSTKIQACSCAPKGSPCEAFGLASAVFIGVVINSSRSERGGIYLLRVEEDFLGNLDQSVQVTSNKIVCGFEFIDGEKYLVYGGGDVTNLSASYCGRTQRLVDAKEDLEFLRGLTVAGEGAEVTGEVGIVKEGKNKTSIISVPEIVIRVEGSGQYIDTRTDSQGRYEVKGLKGGTYKIRILNAGDYKWDFQSIDLRINDRGCANWNFYAREKERDK